MSRVRIRSPAPAKPGTLVEIGAGETAPFSFNVTQPERIYIARVERIIDKFQVQAAPEEPAVGNVAMPLWAGLAVGTVLVLGGGVLDGWTTQRSTQAAGASREPRESQLTMKSRMATSANKNPIAVNTTPMTTTTATDHGRDFGRWRKSSPGSRPICFLLRTTTRPKPKERKLKTNSAA